MKGKPKEIREKERNKRDGGGGDRDRRRECWRKGAEGRGGKIKGGQIKK